MQASAYIVQCYTCSARLKFCCICGNYKRNLIYKNIQFVLCRVQKRLCNHRDMQIECNDDIKAILLLSLFSVRDAKTKRKANKKLFSMDLSGMMRFNEN